MTTLKEQVLATKQLLLDEGWCQWSFCNAAGAKCILGALAAVTAGDRGAYYSAYLALQATTPASFAKDRSPTAFNDFPETQLGDVLEWCDRAATLCA